MPRLGWMALFFFVAASDPSWALHAVDHRVTYVGVLYDEQGSPLAEQPIELRDPALPDPLATTTTTAIGTYHMVAHLHDQDRGRRLALVHGTRTQPVIVDFDPNDHTHERVQRIDFGTPASSSIVAWILPVTGFLALLTIGIWVRWAEHKRATCPTAGVTGPPSTPHTGVHP